MNEKYTIRLYQDNLYELINNFTTEQVMVGTLYEINAFLDLEKKGFKL